MACASAPVANSQSGCGSSRCSAMASAQRSAWWIEEEPVSSASSTGLPSGSRFQPICPPGCWSRSTNSTAAKTVGHIRSTNASSPVAR